MKIGEEIVGRYRIERLLGEGGFGAVYHAVDIKTGHPVAVKVLLAPDATKPDRRRRFLEEARALMQIHHPSVVRVLRVSADEPDPPYIVLESVEGRNLESYLRATGPLPGRYTLVLTKEIVAAVQAIHRAGFVHRDINPSNVLILDELPKALDVGHVRLKLTDFGLASSLWAQSSIASPLGVLRYMSPEAFRGEHADPRCDIYSLGVMLYELLTGEPPFARRTPEEVANWYASGDPLPDRDAPRQDLPRRLHDIALRCMQRDPRERYQTAAELLSELRQTEHEFRDELITPRTVEVEIVLERDFAGFDRRQQRKLIRQLHELLGDSPPI